MLALVAMRLRRPAVAHVLWLLVIVKLLTPPLWRVEVTSDSARVPAAAPAAVVRVSPALDATPPAAFMPPAAAASIEQPVPISPPSALMPIPPTPPTPSAATSAPLCVPCILAAVWLIGSLTWAGVAIARIVRFRRLLRAGARAPDDLAAEIAKIAARMGVARVPAVRLL